jgi:hypothetical protein
MKKILAALLGAAIGSAILVNAQVTSGPTRAAALFATLTQTPTASAAQSGVIRLLNNNGLSWRNAAGSGDLSFYLDTTNTFQLQGGLGITGVFGNFTAINSPAASTIGWNGRSVTDSPANAQWRVYNAAGTAGACLDVSTDGTFKIRDRGCTAATGNLDIGAKVTAYNNVTTAGWGVPSIVANARFTGQTAAKASVATYTVGAADGSFEVSCNVLVTTATTHSFGCNVAYTDEGNTARTVYLDFATPSAYPSGTAAITNGNGAIPYAGTVRHIRAKAATTITINTVGTFTTVTYNVEGVIKQIG